VLEVRNDLQESVDASETPCGGTQGAQNARSCGCRQLNRRVQRVTFVSSQPCKRWMKRVRALQSVLSITRNPLVSATCYLLPTTRTRMRHLLPATLLLLSASCYPLDLYLLYEDSYACYLLPATCDLPRGLVCATCYLLPPAVRTRMRYCYLLSTKCHLLPSTRTRMRLYLLHTKC